MIIPETLDGREIDQALADLKKTLANAPKRNLVEVTILVSLDDIEFGHYLQARNAFEADLDDIELGYATYNGDAVTFNENDEFVAKNWLMDHARGVA